MAAALAERGLRVRATDAVPAMVDLARRHAVETGVSDRIELETADVHELPFDEATFDLVVALGVIPWLHSPYARDQRDGEGDAGRRLRHPDIRQSEAPELRPGPQVQSAARRSQRSGKEGLPATEPSRHTGRRRS